MNEIAGDPRVGQLPEGRLELLMEGIPASDAVAVVQYELPEDSDNSDDGAATVAGFSFLPEKPAMMRVATRDEYEGRFRPSRLHAQLGAVPTTAR